MHSKVTDFIQNTKRWHQEYLVIRQIMSETSLHEDFKWNQPCYTYEDTNLVIIHGLKDAISISFMKGSLLKDPEHMLASPGKNSQATRYMKFTNSDDIIVHKNIIKRYIDEAINYEKAGIKIDFKQSKTLELPDELIIKFQNKPELKEAFEKLTPGRQRAYTIYFSSAKQVETRLNRIEKYEDHILDGKGMNDH